jgi:hypothetical protein
VGVPVGSGDGEEVAVAVETGDGVAQATASRLSSTNRKASFFIRWILLLFLVICAAWWLDSKSQPATTGFLAFHKGITSFPASWRNDAR